MHLSPSRVTEHEEFIETWKVWIHSLVYPLNPKKKSYCRTRNCFSEHRTYNPSICVIRSLPYKHSVTELKVSWSYPKYFLWKAQITGTKKLKDVDRHGVRYLTFINYIFIITLKSLSKPSPWTTSTSLTFTFPHPSSNLSAIFMPFTLSRTAQRWERGGRDYLQFIHFPSTNVKAQSLEDFLRWKRII